MERTSRALRALPWAIALALFVVLVLVLGKLSRVPDERISSAPVVTAVRKIARLATIEYEVMDVIRYEESRTVLFFVNVPKSAILRVRGRVTGGFDLDQGATVDVDEAARTIHVTLSRPRILSIDPTIEWFDERSGFFNPITPDDRTRWTAWAKGALGAAAKRSGIEARAEERARELLVDVGASFGWRVDVRIGTLPSPGGTFEPAVR